MIRIVKRLVTIPFAIALPVGWLAIPAGAAPLLEDGIFRCTISNMFLGEIEINGTTYRGPAYDQKWEGSYPFEETAEKTINWGGPLGGISEAGKVVATVLKKSGKKIGFDITIQNERGNFQTISCSPE